MTSRHLGGVAPDGGDVGRSQAATVPAQRSRSRRPAFVDATAGRLPPRFAAFTQCDLRVMDRTTGASECSLVARSFGHSDATTSFHQLIDQLLTESVGEVGVRRSPTSTIDHDVASVFGRLGHGDDLPSACRPKRRIRTGHSDDHCISDISVIMQQKARQGPSHPRASVGSGEAEQGRRGRSVGLGR